MPEIITASQLRAVLGVSVSLYPDAALNAIIETAEAAIGDFLTQHKVAIVEHAATDNIIQVWTDRPHKFYKTQTIEVDEPHGHGYSGQKTVLEVINDYSFTFTGGSQQNPVADVVKHAVIPHGSATRQGGGLDYYAALPAVEEAILQVSIDVFNSRLAAGGTQQALDYTPAPYRMGRTLLYKVTGLLSKYLDTDSFVG